MRYLKCKYCNGSIDFRDKKCPNCGANTSDVIEEYWNNKKNRPMNDGKDVEKAFFKMFITLGIIIFVFLVIIFLIIFFITKSI